MKKRHNVVQFNFATAKADVDSPVMLDFVAELDRINRLADQSPGFVWRLQTDVGNTMDIIAFPENPRRLITLSIWEDIESFVAFAYSGAHRQIMKRRNEWFDRIDEAYLVLWWVPAGHIPTLVEGKERLEHLKRFGASSHAFNLKERFDPPF